MPLDLELLKNGDRDEWDRAITDLHLVQVPTTGARRFLAFPGAAHLLPHAEDVAVNSLVKLTQRAIRRCPSVEAIPALLRKIVKDEAINLLRRAWARGEVPTRGDRAEDDEPGNTLVERLPAHDLAGIDNFERLQSHIADRMQLETFDLEVFLQHLTRSLNLGAFDEALLRDHIVGHLTQAEFAAAIGCPIGRVGRRKMELIERILRHMNNRAFLWD